MKFGIYGGGMIASFHAQAIKESAFCELAGVCSRSPDSAKKVASEAGCKAFADESDFFADPEIEIVTVATPSGAHLPVIEKAARAGKHVICEKPLEVTPQRVDKAIAVCQENGVTLSGIFNRRFHPAMDLLKQTVDSGRFGKLALAQASIRWYRDSNYYESSSWKGTWALDGGGALMNQSIHAIDQLLYLTGPVRSVQALSTRIEHLGIETEDTAAAALQFENGALGLIEGSTACWSKSGNPAELRLSGSAGSAVLQDESLRQWEFREEQAEADREAEKLMSGEQGAGLGANDPRAINATGHRLNFEDVVNAIQSGHEPRVTAAEARKAVALICAIYESAKTGGASVTV